MGWMHNRLSMRNLMGRDLSDGKQLDGVQNKIFLGANFRFFGSSQIQIIFLDRARREESFPSIYLRWEYVGLF